MHLTYTGIITHEKANSLQNMTPVAPYLSRDYYKFPLPTRQNFHRLHLSYAGIITLYRNCIAYANPKVAPYLSRYHPTSHQEVDQNTKKRNSMRVSLFSYIDVFSVLSLHHSSGHVLLISSPSNAAYTSVSPWYSSFNEKKGASSASSRRNSLSPSQMGRSMILS